MKRITIYKKNSIPITVEDADDSPVSEYSKQLVSLLENNNITILHTSICSVIIRPDEISSIHVCNIDDSGLEMGKSKESKVGDTKEKTSEEFEGIITD